jgi:hypothetical protein
MLQPGEKQQQKEGFFGEGFSSKIAFTDTRNINSLNTGHIENIIFCSMPTIYLMLLFAVWRNAPGLKISAPGKTLPAIAAFGSSISLNYFFNMNQPALLIKTFYS